MLFQALTDAPMLREGVTLNFMAIPQADGATPARIAAGAQVTLRFGHCCPTIKEGRITAASADTAVLSIEGAVWALEPRTSGVAVPGIVSEDWVVTHRAA